jgi:putative SOS response-associated peptidase YedK
MLRYTASMCGRIVRDRLDDYEGYFELVEPPPLDIQPRFNIAPTQMDLIIRARDDGRHLEESRWGLIPVWAKERGIGSRMFNARAETLLEKTAFKGLVGSRRCVIPASGFYEWQSGPRGKTPLYIYRADGAPLALAGLFTFWRDPSTDEWLTSHTIITCGPNEFMEPIHNRMPVVLGKDAMELWLDPSVTGPADVYPVLQPCPDDWLTFHAVSSLVNNAHNEGPRLVEPVDEKERQ